MRMRLILGTIALSLLALSTPVVAGCALCVEETWVQTRDGEPWAEGQPIVLVVRASSTGAELPETALAVVMQTDGERTKCLDVAMKRVSVDGGTATYAGIFHPFRAATYEGRLSISQDVHDIRFTVGEVPVQPVAIPSDVQLPVLPLITFDYEPTLLDRLLQAGMGLAILAAAAVTALVLRRRPRVALAV